MSRPLQPVEEREPVAQQARGQEAPADELLAAQRRAARARRIVERLAAGLGALGGRVDEPAGLAVDDLGDDAAGAAGHRRARLPQRLGHGQAEALADRLLDVTLECTWKALTSTEPTLLRFERMKMSGSPAAYVTVWL